MVGDVVLDTKKESQKRGKQTCRIPSFSDVQVP
jgi:hypothetical protein